ncbi:GtrA family protein [Silicimonas sp. MF1-12-2]|uniref:GtrA family protein n=1 Tax=Silicimonas sp. MF1-12-2 TaxID=3384793 RepID=UPI0039B412D3
MTQVEFLRLLRFSTTGGLVALIYVVIYLMLASEAGLGQFQANLIAFSLAVIFQYIVQTLWTFKASIWSAPQVFRFALTIGLGLLFSSIITSLAGPYFSWPSWLSALVVVVVLPVLNYIIFRFWVYRIPSAREDYR